MVLKVEDLIQTCPSCNGAGIIYDPPRDANNSYGQSFGRTSSKDCSRCRNSGKIITEQGEAVLALVLLAKKQNRI